MTRAARLTALLGLLAVAAVALQLPDLPTPAPPPRPQASPTPAPPRPRPTHEREQTGRALPQAVLEQRPLLTHLPIRLAGVTIAAAGPTGDGRTRLTISAGPRGRAYGRALYGRTLRLFGDSGHGYQVRWTE